MSTRSGPVVETADGLSLVTSVHGPHDAPTIVVQHGVGSSRRFLEEAVVPPLVAIGWQVVAAPLRGHAGASPVRDPSGFGLAALAGDVAAIVAATDARACGGVSVGGHAAVTAVARQLAPAGTRVVAALPAWTGRTRPGVGPHAVVADEIRAVGVAGMYRRLLLTDGMRPWLRRVLLRDLASHDEPSLAAALVALDGGEAPTLADLGSLPAGCGVVAWDDDPGHPLEVAHRWAMTAPGARLVTLDLADPDDDECALGHAVAAAIGEP